MKEILSESGERSFDNGLFTVHGVEEGHDDKGNATRSIKISLSNPRWQTHSVELKIWPEDPEPDRHIGISSRGEMVDTDYSFPIDALKYALEMLEAQSE